MNPNQVNNFFGIKVSKPGINVANASDTQLIYKDNYSTKTYYDESNSRIVEGLLPDGTYGMWVSKPGFDVTTGQNLIFNSNQDMFKIIETGTGVLPSSSAVASGGFSPDFSEMVAVIPHNLGFVPIVQVYAQLSAFFFVNGDFQKVISYVQLPILNNDNGVYSFPNGIYSGGTNEINFTIWTAVDITNVYIQATFETSATSGSVTSGTIPFRYYLLQETAAA